MISLTVAGFSVGIDHTRTLAEFPVDKRRGREIQVRRDGGIFRAGHEVSHHKAPGIAAVMLLIASVSPCFLLLFRDCKGLRGDLERMSRRVTAWCQTPE